MHEKLFSNYTFLTILSNEMSPVYHLIYLKYKISHKQTPITQLRHLILNTSKIQSPIVNSKSNMISSLGHPQSNDANQFLVNTISLVRYDLKTWNFKWVSTLGLTRYTKLLVGICLLIRLFGHPKTNSWYRDIFKVVRIALEVWKGE